MNAEHVPIVEMTEAEGAYTMWAMSSHVDTGGLCNCGHEGLGIDWHLAECRGANHALRAKVCDLYADLYSR